MTENAWIADQWIVAAKAVQVRAAHAHHLHLQQKSAVGGDRLFDPNHAKIARREE